MTGSERGVGRGEAGGVGIASGDIGLVRCCGGEDEEGKTDGVTGCDKAGVGAG